MTPGRIELSFHFTMSGQLPGEFQTIAQIHILPAGKYMCENLLALHT